MPYKREPEEIRLIRRLKAHHGLRQREIARRLGVTESLVSMWASGQRKPTEARMAALRKLPEDTR